MFPGFTQQTNDFLWLLRLNNNRDWFQAHKQDYLDQVQTPMRQLAEEVYDRFSAAHQDLSLLLRVSRIYRDARRLYGRGPYKSHLWFSLGLGGQERMTYPVFWFEIYPTGYAYGLGIYPTKPALMARFRQEIDRDPEEMRRLARAFQRQDRFALTAEEYKRPKGQAEPPLDQWYNRKGLDLTCNRPVDELLYSPALVDELLAAFEALIPYHRYFSALCSREA